jgi:hypothetical protein
MFVRHVRATHDHSQFCVSNVRPGSLFDESIEEGEEGEEETPDDNHIEPTTVVGLSVSSELRGVHSAWGENSRQSLSTSPTSGTRECLDSAENNGAPSDLDDGPQGCLANVLHGGQIQTSNPTSGRGSGIRWIINRLKRCLLTNSRSTDVLKIPMAARTGHHFPKLTLARPPPTIYHPCPIEYRWLDNFPGIKPSLTLPPLAPSDTIATRAPGSSTNTYETFLRRHLDEVWLSSGLSDPKYGKCSEWRRTALQVCSTLVSVASEPLSSSTYRYNTRMHRLRCGVQFTLMLGTIQIRRWADGLYHLCTAHVAECTELKDPLGGVSILLDCWRRDSEIDLLLKDQRCTLWGAPDGSPYTRRSHGSATSGYASFWTLTDRAILLSDHLAWVCAAVCHTLELIERSTRGHPLATYHYNQFSMVFESYQALIKATDIFVETLQASCSALEIAGFSNPGKTRSRTRSEFRPRDANKSFFERLSPERGSLRQLVRTGNNNTVVSFDGFSTS